VLGQLRYLRRDETTTRALPLDDPEVSRGLFITNALADYIPNGVGAAVESL
jgi:hypothetical protein